MDKGKNIQMELTEEELQRNIERITQEIQEAKEEGLRVDIATAIYKVAAVTLDEDLASQMKRKKDVERETKSLRDKLDTLRMKVQEIEAREAMIDSETAALLAKSMLLDKELTVHMNLTGGKDPAYEQGAANSGPDNAHPEMTKEDDAEEIKLADHPYFTRSKDPADSFPRQSSDRGKAVMGDNNEEVSLTEVVVAQPTVAEQNELNMQLMQQVAKMRVEMQRRQDVPPPGFSPNTDFFLKLQ
ncbi:hypothetical protein EJD97_015181 [Solanum chilense]|uniref:Uncharacterized protein n=1 Tax=Solanum chilense TaxID=4083 RepID=A0A6N2AI46_SOLCI|nr:hypothetical protein EJD97_015181 [Solanum chilense]